MDDGELVEALASYQRAARGTSRSGDLRPQLLAALQALRSALLGNKLFTEAQIAMDEIRKLE